MQRQLSSTGAPCKERPAGSGVAQVQQGRAQLCSIAGIRSPYCQALQVNGLLMAVSMRDATFMGRLRDLISSTSQREEEGLQYLVEEHCCIMGCFNILAPSTPCSSQPSGLPPLHNACIREGVTDCIVHTVIQPDPLYARAHGFLLLRVKETM